MFWGKFQFKKKKKSRTETRGEGKKRERKGEEGRGRRRNRRWCSGLGRWRDRRSNRKQLWRLQIQPDRQVSKIPSGGVRRGGKFFVGYGLELSRIVPLIIYHLKRKYLCKIEAERREGWAPGDLGLATRVPGDMLVVTIVLCYSVIAPIIIPFAALYFALDWFVLRNQVLKVYVPSYESYGRMWLHINTRIVASLLLYQVLTVGYFNKEVLLCSILDPSSNTLPSL
ncbi:CSC1-like protein ERD4 [Camellia lanceoleosa]|uniref:CSC1-like protein ERD4 n=1 Tax=Camellia lanceoleosa TaxID=1840588 RepID=A0ACC0FCZ0_9ERIC|nr:CSC1-like protein ERD4 [Camellia lanceoleosa]